MTPRIPLLAAWLSLCVLGVDARATPPAATGGKTAYRIFLLTRDPAEQFPENGGLDPLVKLQANVRNEFLRLGAHPEALADDGRFNTVRPDAAMRENQLTIYTASWTEAELAEARQIEGLNDPHIKVVIEPAAAATPAPQRGRRAVAPPADELVASRVAEALHVTQRLPPSLFSGKRQPWDGGDTDSVLNDMSQTASLLGVPVYSLPAPAETQRRLQLKLSTPPAPLRPGEQAPPSPVTAGTLRYDAFVVEAAARSHVDADVLRSLMFASEGYAGNFKAGTGLFGPMGLSMATGRDQGLTRDTIKDPHANILAAAEYLRKLQTMFGGNLSRAVAAYHCGSGSVVASGGIPQNCVDFVGKFYLAYQNGAAWAVNQHEPRYRRPVIPEGSVSNAGAVARAVRDRVMQEVEGETQPNRPWSSRKIPDELLGYIKKAVRDNYYSQFYPQHPPVQLSEELMIGLVYAEGGWERLTERPNDWKAVGATQVTPPGARPHCKEPLLDKRTHRVEMALDWDSIKALHNQKNVECGAKVLYDHIHDFSDDTDNNEKYVKTPVDPIIALAIYNTQADYWADIRRNNKIPTIQETIDHTMRAAHVYCALTGEQPLKPESYRTNAARELAKYAERVTVKNDFVADKNPYTKNCLIFN